MKYFLLIIATVFSSFVFAQREDHKWYFSDTNIGLFFDYNTNAVSITHEHVPMNFAGAYSVACNNVTGQLMYYTDGSKVWDKNHLVMPNGNALNSGLHPIQTGLTCYYPGHPNHLFIISTTGDGATAGNIYYSEIDMSLPGNGTIANPTGDVVSAAKNILLTTQSTEGLKIISGTTNCYWLIVPQINSTNVRVFKINNNGITLNNTYNIGVDVGIVSYTEYSPVSHKLAVANFNGNQPSIVMDFNEATGQISNSLAIPGTSFYGSGICAVEWSPSGQLLYLTRYRNNSSSSSGQLLQYNIYTPSTSAIVIATMLPSSNSNGSKGLKLAPDGKIYHVWGLDSNTYLGTINSPDMVGVACNYVPLSLNMGQALDYLHTLSEPLLPPVCFNITVNNATICSGQSTTLTASGATTYVWNNGLDTNHLQVVNPTITTSYIVTGTTGTCVTSDTATVFVNQNPIPSITGNLSFCTGGYTFLDAGPGYIFYNWSQGGHTQSINVTTAGTYMVTVTNANGCTGTNQVIVTSTPSNLQVTLSSNSPICESQTLNLTSLPTGGTNYSWTGPNGFTSSLQNPTITNATTFATGIYSVTVTFSGGCTATGQISASVNSAPSLTLISDTMILLNDSIQLEVSGASSYLWSPANGLSCTTCSNPIATPNHSITYCVVGTNANGCSDTACVKISLGNDCGEIWVPSAFSPNGDNENDVLYVYGKCIKTMEFKIFNRWGEEVFESTDPAVGWNGVFRGKESDTDVFVYYLIAEDNFGSKYKLKGNITLMH